MIAYIHGFIKFSSFQKYTILEKLQSVNGIYTIGIEVNETGT